MAIELPVDRIQENRLDITLIVLTLNETVHLRRLLSSACGLFRRIIVVDSYSTDDTVAVAQEYGAEVFQRKWKNYSDQFAWAMSQNITTAWTMRLDADEVLDMSFRQEFERKVPLFGEDITGILLEWKTIFMGRWIKHGGRSGIYLLRVWRTGLASIESRWMDEHMILEKGLPETFHSKFEDRNLNNLSFFISKHNKYASREAIDYIVRNILKWKNHSEGLSKQALFKRELKEKVYYNISPLAAPFIYFLYRYILRLGFLDGKEGLIYHSLQGLWYRFLVGAKIVELKRLIADTDQADEIVARLEKHTGLRLQRGTAA